jgi:hypothetical protein
MEDRTVNETLSELLYDARLALFGVEWRHEIIRKRQCGRIIVDLIGVDYTDPLDITCAPEIMAAVTVA